MDRRVSGAVFLCAAGAQLAVAVGVQAAQVHRLQVRALRGSARTIGAFLFFVLLLQVVLGYSIFVIESARPDS